MGIRFNCSNGHRLHVKAFLAGKRGICPKCGIKVDIPSAAIERGNLGRMGAPHAVAVSGLTPPAGNLQPPPAATVTPPAAEPPATIDSESSFSWHVRIPSGDQFGPADASTIRKWAAEGRIGPECKVWREGWEQWKPWNEVAQSFKAPNIGAPNIPSAEKAQAVDGVVALQAEINSEAGGAGDFQIETHQVAVRKKSHVLVYILLVACLGLLFPLVWVLRGS